MSFRALADGGDNRLVSDGRAVMFAPDTQYSAAAPPAAGQAITDQAITDNVVRRMVPIFPGLVPGSAQPVFRP